MVDETNNMVVVWWVPTRRHLHDIKVLINWSGCLIFKYTERLPEAHFPNPTVNPSVLDSSFMALFFLLILSLLPIYPRKHYLFLILTQGPFPFSNITHHHHFGFIISMSLCFPPVRRHHWSFPAQSASHRTNKSWSERCRVSTKWDSFPVSLQRSFIKSVAGVPLEEILRYYNGNVTLLTFYSAIFRRRKIIVLN